MIPNAPTMPPPAGGWQQPPTMPPPMGGWQEPQPQWQPPKRNNNQQRWLIALGVLLAAAVAAVLALVVTRPSSTPTTASTPTATTAPATTAPATQPATTPPTTHPASNVPVSSAQIAAEILRTKNGLGVSAKSVTILGNPWMMNGVEVAETNVQWSDGSVYHMHFVLDPASGYWHLHTQFKVTSIHSTEGLSQPFPNREASKAGARGKE